MTELRFPTLSQENAEAVGVLATWYVRDGESVADGQLVADVQLDKVDAEVIAPGAGVIHLVAEEGAEIAQGSVIATID